MPHTRSIHRHKVVDSTNTQAKRLVRQLWDQDIPARGNVVVAEQQTAGRGQYGRSWQSPAGGLYLSAIVEEVDPFSREKLPLAAGAAVANALQHILHNHLGLRWPNDIMLDGKKLGGILCESMAEGSRWAAIIGIGLNVNVEMQELPAELRGTATSLLAHLGRKCDLAALENKILGELFIMAEHPSREAMLLVMQRARELDTLRGSHVELQDGPRTITGVAAGLSNSGALLIQTASGPLEVSTATLISVAGQQLRTSP